MPKMVGNLREAKILRWGETRNSFQGLEFYVQNKPDSGCSALKSRRKLWAGERKLDISALWTVTDAEVRGVGRPS